MVEVAISMSALIGKLDGGACDHYEMLKEVTLGERGRRGVRRFCTKF